MPVYFSFIIMVLAISLIIWYAYSYFNLENNYDRQKKIEDYLELDEDYIVKRKELNNALYKNNFQRRKEENDKLDKKIKDIIKDKMIEDLIEIGEIEKAKDLQKNRLKNKKR
jgi:hypothetical protein